VVRLPTKSILSRFRLLCIGHRRLACHTPGQSLLLFKFRCHLYILSPSLAPPRASGIRRAHFEAVPRRLSLPTSFCYAPLSPSPTPLTSVPLSLPRSPFASKVYQINRQLSRVHHSDLMNPTLTLRPCICNCSRWTKPAKWRVEGRRGIQGISLMAKTDCNGVYIYA
jgi:hypothetical protein